MEKGIRKQRVESECKYNQATKIEAKLSRDAVDPCRLCGKRVIRNSIQLQICEYWTHKRCFKGRLMNEMNCECGRFKEGMKKDKKIQEIWM